MNTQNAFDAGLNFNRTSTIRGASEFHAAAREAAIAYSSDQRFALAFMAGANSQAHSAHQRVGA